MLPFAENVVTGVVTGVYAERIRRTIDGWLHDDPGASQLSDYERANLFQQGEIVRLLAHLVKLNTDHDNPKDGIIERTVQISPDPTWHTLYREGRAHLMILTTASVSVKMQIPGVGVYTVNLFAGWNLLDTPDGTQIALASGATAVNVLVRKDNEAIGAAI
jgi:hypothetical protein